LDAGGGNIEDEPQADGPFGSADDEPSLGATEELNQEVAWKHTSSGYTDAEAEGTVDDLEAPYPTREQADAQRAAVQEAVGRLTEITGMRAYRGSSGNVRFYEEDQVKMMSNLRVVGVLR
jgi:hypothetical protein